MVRGVCSVNAVPDLTNSFWCFCRTQFLVMFNSDLTTQPNSGHCRLLDSHCPGISSVKICFFFSDKPLKVQTVQCFSTVGCAPISLTLKESRQTVRNCFWMLQFHYRCSKSLCCPLDKFTSEQTSHLLSSNFAMTTLLCLILVSTISSSMICNSKIPFVLLSFLHIMAFQVTSELYSGLIWDFSTSVLKLFFWSCWLILIKAS